MSVTQFGNLKYQTLESRCLHQNLRRTRRLPGRLAPTCLRVREESLENLSLGTSQWSSFDGLVAVPRPSRAASGGARADVADARRDCAGPNETWVKPSSSMPIPEAPILNLPLRCAGICDQPQLNGKAALPSGPVVVEQTGQSHEIS